MTRCIYQPECTLKNTQKDVKGTLPWETLLVALDGEVMHQLPNPKTLDL